MTPNVCRSKCNKSNDVTRSLLGERLVSYQFQTRDRVLGHMTLRERLCRCSNGRICRSTPTFWHSAGCSRKIINNQLPRYLMLVITSHPYMSLCQRFWSKTSRFLLGITEQCDSTKTAL